VGLDLPPRTPLIEGVPACGVRENRDKRGYRGCGGVDFAISRLIAIHSVILTRARVAGGWVRALATTTVTHRYSGVPQSNLDVALVAQSGWS
jgi:hypothetical protein